MKKYNLIAIIISLGAISAFITFESVAFLFIGLIVVAPFALLAEVEDREELKKKVENQK